MDSKNIIKERRLELGLTYEELGKLVGVGKSTVRKWETGLIENIKRDNIVALAKALKISPALIMGWNLEEDNNNLSEDELLLLNNYKTLNKIGKLEAIKRVSELTEINKYVCKDSINSLDELSCTLAAHDDDLTEAEKIESDKRILELLKKRNK